MIKILENGKYRIVTCSCGCKYSFDLTDIDENKQVTCPECKTKNTVEVQEESK